MTQVQESSEARAARPAPAHNGWPGVAALALGTFTVVTSEMLPVGLLTPMGRSLGVPEGVAGLTLTITGLVAALSAPALVPLLGRADRRTALCVLVAVLVVGNLGAAWAPDFGTMVVARVLVGIGMGGVWAVAAGLAVRLVPAKSSRHRHLPGLQRHRRGVRPGRPRRNVPRRPRGLARRVPGGRRARGRGAGRGGAPAAPAARRAYGSARRGAAADPRPPAAHRSPRRRLPGHRALRRVHLRQAGSGGRHRRRSGHDRRPAPGVRNRRMRPGTSSPGPEPPAHRARRCW